LVASDQFANFVEEKIDVTIRVGELRGASLIVRRLVQNTHVLRATPDYLKANTALVTQANLAEHNCLLLHFRGTQQLQ